MNHPVAARPPELLHYRPWRGRLGGPWRGVWAIARTGLLALLRRKLFWAMYGGCAGVFLFFFFAQYLMTHFSAQVGEGNVKFNQSTRVELDPARFAGLVREQLKMNGTGETYRNFIWWESNIVMAVLALAGSALVGNDFRFGSLPFYLSKPLHRWHYVLGKCLAVGAFVNLLTTAPAVILWVEYGLLEGYGYYWDSLHLLGGILAYGAVLTAVLSLLLVAAATWLRRTVPLVMVWTAVFVFGAQLGRYLGRLNGAPRWKLMDLWNDAYVLGNYSLALPAETGQPASIEAAAVLMSVCGLCGLYLNRRIRAVEVV